MTELRVASFVEIDPRTAYLIWKLRVDVFVVEQNCPYPDLDGRDLESATEHLWIERDGAPLAYLRILDDGDVARIGRVVCASSERGAGHASALMRAAIERIGQRASVLDAQSYLTKWYAGFGYEVDGDEFLEDGIPHTPMRRTSSATSNTPS